MKVPRAKPMAERFFFDEIGEMDIGLQAKLLRFIQTGQYQKVGSDKVETVDIRFISATNRNPLDAIKQQRLREDLYYRLNVISIHLPNLHERENDAVLIAEHFLKTLSQSEDKMFVGIDKKAEKLIRHYTWPGNVRQLENAIHSAIVMSDGPLLSEEALMFSLNLNSNAVASLLSTNQPEYLENLSIQNTTPRKNIIPLAEVERLTIERAISLHAGNVVAAASALGVSPSTLYRKIQAWQN